MKKYSLLLFLAFQCFSFGLLAQTALMTFNIRYDNPEDGDNWWEYRKQPIVDMLRFHAPDILGVQEAIHQQVVFLASKLPDYDYVGVGRDDGKTKGEYAAIFYNTNRFKPLFSQTYWLSTTPEKVSVGWDASMERITTYAQLLDLKTLDTLHVFNAHFDHRGAEARKQSATLITKLIEDLGLTNQQLVVMGDFNCQPQEAPMTIFGTVLEDTYQISQQQSYGPAGTWASFDQQTIATRRIDYILTKNIEVLQHAHLADRRPNNLHLSDHLPVFITIN